MERDTRGVVAGMVVGVVLPVVVVMLLLALTGCVAGAIVADECAPAALVTGCDDKEPEE